MAETRAGEDAYRAAGVDIEAAARAVELIRKIAVGATRAEVVEGIGGFAGLFDLGDGRYLAAATDGVGTKLEIAGMLGILDTVGIDLVAMCANDVVCTGAEPLFFLDYLAVDRLVPEDAAAIVSGIAEGCRLAGCALLGGETAEHPGVMGPRRFDLAGFCVGIARSDELLRSETVKPGDALVGFRSSGLHSNGYSLVRRALFADRGDVQIVSTLTTPDARLAGRTLGEELLRPTLLYVRPLLALARAGLVRSAANITGGGWLENVPRALPQGLGARVDAGSWEPQPIFEIVGDAAGLDRAALFEVLNMGIGMVAIVPDGSEDETLAAAAQVGLAALVVGRVEDEPGIRFDGLAGSP